MNEQSNFNDKVLKDKIKTLRDENNVIKKWNEGLGIKSLILFPIILFLVGLFIVNSPENLTDVLFIFLYPLALILISLVILFVMENNLN
tara:strand:+ start:238 stop:504 length:267 start_codon:yes stop_codon:yes gene_type:complete